MDSKIGRVALGVAALAAAVVLLVVLSSSDDSGDNGEAASKPGAQASKPAKPAIPTIVVRDGQPVGGVKELDFEAGDTIRFAVRSDAPDDLHVHGYDVERELPAGRKVVVQFPASIEGIFEAELHESEEQIAELRIEP
jgi:hypothetical protein